MFAQRKMPCVRLGLALPALISLASGCASTPCKFKQTGSSADLSLYKTCYVADATAASGVVVPTDVLKRTSDRIASELRGRRTFEKTVRKDPGGQEPCLHVQTEYTSYRPGSRMARALLIGLGTADLKARVQLRDGGDGSQVAVGKVHEFWGFGGLMGMSRGIEDMEQTAWSHIGQGIDKTCRSAGRMR